MNTCETCKHWKDKRKRYCNNDKVYECFPRNRILYPTKDFGCIHWEGERKTCYPSGDGGVFMHVELMTNTITEAKIPDWIGQIYNPEIHIPPNSKENP